MATLDAPTVRHMLRAMAKTDAFLESILKCVPHTAELVACAKLWNETARDDLLEIAITDVEVETIERETV